MSCSPEDRVAFTRTTSRHRRYRSRIGSETRRFPWERRERSARKGRGPAPHASRGHGLSFASYVCRRSGAAPPRVRRSATRSKPSHTGLVVPAHTTLLSTTRREDGSLDRVNTRSQTPSDRDLLLAVQQVRGGNRSITNRRDAWEQDLWDAYLLDGPARHGCSVRGAVD